MVVRAEIMRRPWHSTPPPGLSHWSHVHMDAHVYTRDAWTVLLGTAGGIFLGLCSDLGLYAGGGASVTVTTCRPESPATSSWSEPETETEQSVDWPPV